MRAVWREIEPKEVQSRHRRRCRQRRPSMCRDLLYGRVSVAPRRDDTLRVMPLSRVKIRQPIMSRLLMSPDAERPCIQDHLAC